MYLGTCVLPTRRNKSVIKIHLLSYAVYLFKCYKLTYVEFNIFQHVL